MSYRITTGWHRGPPPSIGWWPASVSNDCTCLRWWDGKHWSQPAWRGDGSGLAARQAKRKVDRSTAQDIDWRHRPASWPARSRT